MRKLMIAAVAVAGVALSAGCQDKREAVQDKQADLAKTEAQNRQQEAEKRQEAQADIAQKEANDRKEEINKLENKQEDIAKTVADNREEEAKKRKDLLDAKQDLANDTRVNDDRLNDNLAIGGSGMAGETAPASLQGTLKSTGHDKLTLTDQAGVEQKIKLNDATKITWNGNLVKVKDFDNQFKEGTQIRTSYVLDKDHDKVARDLEVLSPVMKKK